MWFQVFVTLLSLTITCCSTNVWFSADEYTGYVNDATQLNCTVTGLLNEDIVIFSRKKTANDKEQILSTFEISKQAKLIVSGIHISTVEMSSNDYLLVLAIDSVSCEDRGTYFCKVGDRQTSARLFIWQKPDIPKFTMSKIIVEDRYMLAEHPLICEGEVGGPGGNIFVETYTSGSYTQYQYYLVSRDIEGSEDTCSTYLTLKFAVPGHVSLALNNTAMRCVATNNITLIQNMSKPASQPKRLYVVPATYCNGLTNGNYRHPYECTMFIECSSDWLIADTCRTLCAHVEGMGKISCRNCSSVDCMDHATASTTIKPREPHFHVLDMPYHIIGPLFGIIAVLLVAIVIAVVICHRRERKSGNKPPPDSPTPHRMNCLGRQDLGGSYLYVINCNGTRII